MHAAVETALAEIATAVQEAGGCVLRRDADTILAAFGLPVAIEDHAARACRAALAVAAGLEQRHGGSLRVAIALDSGEVVRFADGGPDERPKAVGHCLSRAARLAASGRVRAVVATAATRALARSAIQFARLEPLALDPEAGPIELYAPDRAAAEHGRVHGGAQAGAVRRPRSRARCHGGGVRTDRREGAGSWSRSSASRASENRASATSCCVIASRRSGGRSIAAPIHSSPRPPTSRSPACSARSSA